MIELCKIEDSYRRISKYLKATRLEKSIYLSDTQSQVYLKLENEQPIVKTFKIRGALSKLTTLTEAEKEMRTAAISSGNHGAALAYGAQLLGLKKPVIFVPLTAPLPKIKKMEYFGAMVKRMGHIFDDTNMMAEQIIKEEGYVKVDSREDEVGVCGQGTVAVEILKQLPDVEVIIVPMGSGGLAIGVGSYVKQKKAGVKVIGVEAENSPALVDNLRNGVWTKTYAVEGEPLLKSLIGGVAKLTFEHASSCVDDILLVNDGEAKAAVAEIAKKEKVICEPDSAVVYAAYKKEIEQFAGKKVVLVISGGNIADDLFKEVIAEYY